MKGLHKEIYEEFCKGCDNFLLGPAACKEVNSEFRRKYVLGDRCYRAIIKGVPVSILSKKRIMVGVGGEWYERDDMKKIESALDEKRKRLQMEGP